MTTRAPTKLYTVGYEQTGQPALIRTLADLGVKTLIDVRDLPSSRRAGFSKRSLAASLDAAGIGYVHLKPLGTPKEGRIANRNRQWKRFWSIVETQLATPEADEAFEHAARVAQAGTACLLCFEKDPQTCHRLRVATELERRYGFAIEHLHVDAPSLV